MSAPIPMPAPSTYALPANIMTGPSAHHIAHSSYHPPSVSSAGYPSMNGCEPTSLSPSNVSTHSSAFPPAPSTAATSPNSTFIINQAPGFAPYQNPNATTRILQLSDFNKDLKTRDIQLVFAEWEDDRGGFKIKWIDDTSCLIVFADPGVAKRAFLNVLSNPPPSLTSHGPNGPQAAKLRAYNGPDVVHILASVQNRPRSRSNASQSLHSRASSMASLNGGPGLGRRPSMGALAARNRASISSASGRPPSANPIVQAQVQELIDHVTTAHTTATTVHGDLDSINSNSGTVRARIDDAGKRFIAAGLGKPLSAIPGLDDGTTAANYSLANLTIEEEVFTPTAASH